jgi:nucleoside-diphosphate-sugar epimerase
MASEFLGTRVLVTGASGFLGRAAIHTLSLSGAEVHALARGASPAGTDVTWWQADLSSGAGVDAAFRGARPQVVWHLAGLADGRPTESLTLPTIQHNITGTANALIAARKYECRRFLYCSSMEEPDRGDGIPYSPYGASKFAAGLYAQLYHRAFGLETVLLRPYLVYGPGQSAGKVIPFVIRSLLGGTSPRLTSCSREVDAVFVDDVIRGFAAASFAPGIAGMKIDLGSGTLVTLREIIDSIAKHVGGSALPLYGALPDRPHETAQAADLAPARSLLGWHPRVPLVEGLRITVSHFRAEAARASGASVSDSVES